MPSLPGSRSRFASSFATLLLGGMLTGACGTAHSGTPNDGSAGAAGDGSHGPGAGRAGNAAASGTGGTRAGTAGRAGDAAGSGTGGAKAGSGGSAGVAGESSAAGRGGDASPTETTFVVRNDGEDALMLGSTCGALWPSLFEGDNQLGLVNTCSCPCADQSVCGCPAVCLNTQELVVPGKSVSKTWAGTTLDYSTNMARSCYVERVPASGTKLEARACWNYGTRGMAETCSTEWFAYGRDTTVTISAKPALASSKPTTVGIKNASADPIYVVKNRCGAQDWFRLDMGKEISVNTFCGCGCDENFKATTCPVCGQCAPDEFEKVAPGATVTFEWDNRFRYHYDSGCSKQYNMPAESRLNVQLCWSRTPDGDTVCQGTIVELNGSNVLTVG
jgi:hypothetical protein